MHMFLIVFDDNRRYYIVQSSVTGTKQGHHTCLTKQFSQVELKLFRFSVDFFNNFAPSDYI